MTNAEATITENTATVAEQGAHVAPEKASSKKGATQKKGAPKGKKSAKGGKTKPSLKTEAKAGKKAKPAPAKEPSTPRAESNGAKILELIGRPRGARFQIEAATCEGGGFSYLSRGTLIRLERFLNTWQQVRGYRVMRSLFICARWPAVHTPWNSTSRVLFESPRP
jgi:hypothetical protein